MGLFDYMGPANPRRYLPEALGGHTPQQMREAHHVDLYSAKQHATALASQMSMKVNINQRPGAPNRHQDPATDYARNQANTVGGAGPMSLT